MIIGGEPISAVDALNYGLIDEIVADPLPVARHLPARSFEKRPLRRLRDCDSQTGAAKADRSIFTDAIA